jgi:hypothetical protein
MKNSTIRWINAVAVRPAAAAKLFGQEWTRTGCRALLLGLLAALVTICAATNARAQVPSWQIAIVGNTGCGQTALMFNGLNPDGATQALALGAVYYGTLVGSSGCGSSSSTQTFTITSLSANGSGTATLSCGPGCGWNFDIHGHPGGTTFNLVDVANGGDNVLAGTAILGGVLPPPYEISFLDGPWQIALVGNTGCGRSSMLFTGVLDATSPTTGTATGTLTGSSGCGSSSSTQTFTITSWDWLYGSGTANLTCGPGCGWNFDIQVDPLWQTFNLVDVANGGDNVLAGTAIRVVEGPAITMGQLAGPWQIALVGNTGCGQTALLFSGSLNASGTATGTLTGSSGCGSSSSPRQTFTITSLNANGSGTANLTCGSGCGWNFDIQVAANGQTFDLVDVANGGANVLAGTAIAGGGS